MHVTKSYDFVLAKTAKAAMIKQQNRFSCFISVFCCVVTMAEQIQVMCSSCDHQNLSTSVLWVQAEE